MKKFLKVLLFITSFVFFISFVNADGVCDHFRIYTNGELTELKWKTPTYVCSFTERESEFDSGCSFTTLWDAQNKCEGTWQNPCTGEISRSGKCSDETICFCFEYNYELTTYSGYSCGGCHPNYADTDGDGIANDYVGCTYDTCCKKEVESGPKMFGADDCLQTRDAALSKVNEFRDEKMKIALSNSCTDTENGGVYIGKFTDQYPPQPFYRVKYPIYYCDSSHSKIEVVDGMRDYKYCADSIVDSDLEGCEIDAYCVNPDEKVPVKEKPPGYNANHAGTNVYDIDATKCKNSYSSVDCGYANIMIEGNYRSQFLGKEVYSKYEVIMTALRLWSVHVGATGFGEPGYGETSESNTTIGDPNYWLIFVPSPDGTWSNLYKAVYQKLLYTATYRSKDYPSNTDPMIFYDDLFTMNTGIDGLGHLKEGVLDYGKISNKDNDVMGIITGGDGNYLYAFQLFINTLQGNDKMQEHLKALNYKASGITSEDEIIENQDGLLNDPEIAYADYIKGENTIRITYRLREGVEVDCSTLPENKANELGCKMGQTVTIYTSSGTKVEESDYYDYCQKNLCFKDITYSSDDILTCDAIDKIEIIVDSYEKCGANSVKKYIDCADPKDSQMLVSFEPDPYCKKPEIRQKKMTTYLQCDLCEDVSTFKDTTCYKPTENGFTDDEIAVKSSKGKYVYNYSKDPTLNCILHKRSYQDSNESTTELTRPYFDYSDMFGVNTDVCKIYCSDTVNYYLPSREEVNTSLQLKYDIESIVFDKRSISDLNEKAITTIIVTERTCVSKSFLNKTFDYNNTLDIAYGLGDEQLVEHYKTFYRYSEKDAIKAKDKIVDDCGEAFNLKAVLCRLNHLAKKENSRKEVMNSLIYDLYMCNMFTEADVINYTKDNDKDDNKKYYNIVKPKDADMEAVNYAKEIIDNTENYCNTHDCFTGRIRYEGGAKYFKHSGNNSGIVDQNAYDDDAINAQYSGLSGNNPDLSSDFIVSKDLEIKYCNDSRIDPVTKEKMECFPGSNTDGNFVDELDNAYDDSMFGDIPFLSGYVNIPINDYTVFKFRVEGQLYNSTQFYTEQYTGNVREKTDSNYSIYNGKYLSLKNYVYPIDSQAQKICRKNEYSSYLGISNPISECDVKYDFQIPIITKYNSTDKVSLGYKIAFERKNYDDMLAGNIINYSNHYNCSFYVKPAYDEYGFGYKNIDLGTPFPVQREGTNWTTVVDESSDSNHTKYYKNYVSSVINEIKNSDFSYLYATDEYLEYSYRLDAGAIEAIREDNDKNGYFTLPYDCTYTPFGETPKAGQPDNRVYLYTNCNSQFLDELHESDNRFGVEVIESSGISEYTKSKVGGFN